MAAQRQRRSQQAPAAGRQGRAGPPAAGTGPRPLRRPRPLWHPVPLAELLIVAGVVAFAIGALSGSPSRSAPALIAGAAAALLGTAEYSFREHFSGYRSHALLLALIPVVLLHSSVILIAGAFTSVPREANLALLILDAALLYGLFTHLRARFLAERERLLAARERYGASEGRGRS
ncbi:MAG TPA: hypothetical protein VKU89_08295 [Solirubrobacteraceae bacterium]|nr:hypothetical protein [Solirubrobacteraceae bacterium]